MLTITPWDLVVSEARDLSQKLDCKFERLLFSTGCSKNQSTKFSFSFKNLIELLKAILKNVEGGGVTKKLGSSGI